MPLLRPHPAEGSGLLVASLTAYQSITSVAVIKFNGSGKRKNILISAASGGVGHYAVQLVKLGNTHITTTRDPRNIDVVRSLGANEALDYKTPDRAALKSPSGKKYDVVVHCATGIPWSTFETNLSKNGKFIDITPGLSTLMIFAKKQLVLLHLIPMKNLETLMELVEQGKVKTLVDSRYPQSKAEDAWAKAIESHSTGKIIVGP